MMLLNTLGTTSLQPAGFTFDNEEDVGHTFQSSLEALVDAVAVELPEDEIQAEQEPLHTDGTAALMMLLVAPTTWGQMQDRVTNGQAAPSSYSARSLEAPVTANPPFPDSAGIPVPDRTNIPAPQQAATPLLTGMPDVQDEKELLPADIEKKYQPVVSTAAPATRTDKPVTGICPPQLPPKIQPEDMALEEGNQESTTALAENETGPPAEMGHPDAAEDEDAMFLPSSRLVVRNSVPHSSKSEQTAFEVELSDDSDRGNQMEEPLGVASPKLVKESRKIDDRSIAEGSAPRFVTRATSDGREDTKLPQPEAPKATNVTPPANTPSAAKEGGVISSEREPPPSQASGPAALEHKQDKPKPPQASTGLQLRVGPREEVSIHVHQIAGHVRISVRSVDADLTRELQAGVPSLLAVLNETGVHAEATIPDIGSPIAERKESTISNIANTSSGPSQEGSGDAGGGSSGQNRRHRRPDQQWEEWLEER